MRRVASLSLQAKILLSFAVVIVLTAGLGTFFSYRLVDQAFGDYVVRRITIQEQGMLRLISRYVTETGDYEGVEELLASSTPPASWLLVNPDAEIVYAPNAEFIGERVTEDERGTGVSLSFEDGHPWTMIPVMVSRPTGEQERAFTSTVTRSLWEAAAVGAAAALILGLLLMRGITRPLQRLAAATRRIAEGNLTERVEKRSQDAIGRLAASFNDMAESLEQATENQKQLIADISHELRSPITVLRSSLEAIRDHLVEPDDATIAGLHDRVLLTARLVDDLQQLALADAGRLSMNREGVDLGALVKAAAEMIGVQLEDAGIRLEMSVPTELPAVQGDRHRIEQALFNLLSNAMRHTPEGGTISIRVRRTGGDVVVSVCDTGTGVAKADLPHVFERFYRADTSRDRATGGSGLGLAIAKALVEAHGGRIWVENQPNGGACFRFSLPASGHAPM